MKYFVVMHRSTGERAPATGAAREITMLATELANRIQSHFASCVAESRLTTQEARVLLAMEPGETLSMRAVAARTDARPANVTVTVDRLTQRGLISRGDEVSDRRVRTVTLSEEGAATRAHLQARIAQDSPITAGLSTAECRTLHSLLERISEQRPT
jgi:DNA-binding MarR family transcriptional regulator